MSNRGGADGGSVLLSATTALYTDCLSKIASQLLSKILFSSNSAYLKRLRDADDSDDSGDEDDRNPSTRPRSDNKLADALTEEVDDWLGAGEGSGAKGSDALDLDDSIAVDGDLCPLDKYIAKVSDSDALQSCTRPVLLVRTSGNLLNAGGELDRDSV